MKLQTRNGIENADFLFPSFLVTIKASRICWVPSQIMAKEIILHILP
jgi:hypothetical protein